MKWSLAILLLPTFAFATELATLTGVVNLNEIVRPSGRAIGIEGKLPTSFKLEAAKTATLSFGGYQRGSNCLEYGEPEVARHPETAPCLREEIFWTPTLKLTLKKLDGIVTLAERSVKASLLVGPQAGFYVGEDCIANAAALVVQGAEAPLTAPASILVKANCTVQASYSVTKQLAPEALKGHKIDANMIGAVELILSNDVLEMKDGEALKVSTESLRYKRALTSFGSPWGTDTIFDLFTVGINQR